MRCRLLLFVQLREDRGGWCQLGALRVSSHALLLLLHVEDLDFVRCDARLFQYLAILSVDIQRAYVFVLLGEQLDHFGASAWPSEVELACFGFSVHQAL